MKKTVLEIVQSILNDMDSEPVNSIEDSEEALQIASVLQDTYFNTISVREIPEHKQLLVLNSPNDNNYPTYFIYPENTKEIEKVFYNIAEDGTHNFREVYFLEPLDFISRLPQYKSDKTQSVIDINSGTQFYIFNDKQPQYFTSFDDKHLVFDSYKKDVEDILQTSKIKSYGSIYPTFEIADDFVPDIDNTVFPYLIAETKSICFSLFKNGINQKVEQAAKRQKFHMLDNMYKYKKQNKQKRNGYGRRK